MRHSVSPSSHYHPDIQGLRAIAVLLVIYYHSGLPGLPGGYIGVDVFFVISGYLITGLLLREIERSGTLSLSGFYARRMRRLLPAVSLVLLVTIGVAWFSYSPLELRQFSLSALATATYVSNLWFAHLATDYLAASSDNDPVLHTWSLAAEEQFYLVWPFLLLAVLHLGTPSGLRQRLLLTFGLTILVSSAGAVLLTGYNQPWAFFGSPTRAWEFAVGGLLAVWFASDRQLGPRLAVALGMLGLALLVSAALFYSRRTPFPGWAASVPVAGAALIIAAAHADRPRGVNGILATRPLRFIGDLSYSSYLWHWPAFVFAAQWFGTPSVPMRLTHILAVFFLAWLTLVLVENPVRFDRRLSARAVRGLLAGTLLTATMAGTAFGVGALATGELQEPDQQLLTRAEDQRPLVYDKRCHALYLDVAQPDCLFGDPKGKTTLVLFGDSHAAQWFPALHRLAEARHWRLYSLTKAACPSVEYEPYLPELRRQYTECSEWRAATLERIASIRPDLVLVTNSRTYVDATSVAKLAEWRTGMERTLTVLAPLARSVIVLRDTPAPYERVPKCLSVALWQHRDLTSACMVRVIPVDEDGIWRAERDAAAAVGRVRTLDPGHLICKQTPCSAFQDGQVLFRDDEHITVDYSRSLAESLGAELLKASRSGSAR